MGEIPVIELLAAAAHHGDYEILRDVSFALPEGATGFFMGVAGSGKSTLLKTAAGLRPADSGEVLFRGRSLAHMSRKEEAQFRRKSAFVFQDAALWANQSLFDNLALPVRVHESGSSKVEVERAVRRAVELVGYDEDLKARPSDLSSGERRIIGLARALVLDPELLFMDEPFANLDEETSERVVDIVAALKERGRSLAIVTSRSDLVGRFADFVAVLGGGEVLAFGTYDEAVEWSGSAVRAVTGRLKPRSAAPKGEAAWGLAGAWASAFAEDGAVLEAETATLEKRGSGKERAILGDIINAIPDESEEADRGEGAEDEGEEEQT
jgi:phospholipid/cholesterol/gamma-HCH transport system ATP-binding protein